MVARTLSREDVLNWNPKWSQADAELIERHIERLGLDTFTVPANGAYISCSVADGPQLMHIAPGYVEFTRGHGPDDLKDVRWQGYELSTVHNRGAKPPEKWESTDYCPEHFVQLPANGVCQACEA